jgi:L-ascorbate metabolism protein UlaG (beta-lactamase superfamily)
LKNKTVVAFLMLLVAGCIPLTLPLEEGSAKWGVDITWHGHSCFTLRDSLGRTIVIDPFDETVGYGRLSLKADAVLVTHHHFDHDYLNAVRARLRSLDFLESTGTVSVAVGVNVTGIASSHDNENGAVHGPNVIYKFTLGGLTIVHLGDLGQDVLTSDQLTRIGAVDVLMVPVGGVTSLDAAQAKRVVEQLHPAVIFPMHYGDIRFYRLAPVTAFLSLFDENQRRALDDSTVRIRQSELTKTPVVYTLKTIPTN